MFKLQQALRKNKILSYAECWKHTAGPALLKVSEFHGVMNIKNQLTLCLLIQDPVWRQEIFHQRTDVLRRYQRSLETRGLDKENIPTAIQLKAL